MTIAKKYTWTTILFFVDNFILFSFFPYFLKTWMKTAAEI